MNEEESGYVKNDPYPEYSANAGLDVNIASAILPGSAAMVARLRPMMSESYKILALSRRECF